VAEIRTRTGGLVDEERRNAWKLASTFSEHRREEREFTNAMSGHPDHIYLN
jgi:hypothetical protein